MRNEDLALFTDLPAVQTLDLSNNPLTDACLQHLDDLPNLSTLILSNTDISPGAIKNFQAAHPQVDVRTQPSN